VWSAVGLATLCAALVFSFLALRGRSLSQQDGLEKIGPPFPAKMAPATSAALTNRTSVDARTESQAFQLLKRQDRKVTPFILAQSSDFQRLGAIQLKLTSVDVAHGTCNLLLVTKGRRFDKTLVKVNEPVILAPGLSPPLSSAGAGSGSQLLVEVIVPGGVRGYLSEPKRRNSTRAGASHRRHRWYQSKPKSAEHTN
jgi:hypothetical protein